MSYVVLQQVSSPFARSNAAKTLDKPIALKHVERAITQSQQQQIAGRYPEQKLYVWGSKLERRHQISRMAPDDSLILFRRSQYVFRMGIIKDILISVELAEELWGHDKTGHTWGIIYLISLIQDISLHAQEINKAIGRNPSDNWQGMTAIEDPAAKAAIDYVRAHLPKF